LASFCTNHDTGKEVGQAFQPDSEPGQAEKPDRRDLGSGSGLLTRPTSATGGLPVPDRWRVTRSATVGRMAGSRDPRRTNGPTAGSRNPRRTKHHWDSLTTSNWPLATIFSPLATRHSPLFRATRRVKAHTRRAPPFRLGDARVCVSHRIVKDHPHHPDILSLRQDRPTLASVSGRWSLLDGMRAIATGSFLAERHAGSDRIL